MTATREAIEESLEQVAERAGDPTAAVYRRLFARFPEMEPLFVRDTTGAIRGEMMARTLDCALDLAGANAYAANFIACELVNHDGVGVPRETFALFFRVMVETFAELMGEGWTTAYAAAWREVLDRVDATVAAA